MRRIFIFIVLAFINSLTIASEPESKRDEMFEAAYKVASEALCGEGGLSMMFSVSPKNCSKLSASSKEMCKSFVLAETAEREGDSLAKYMAAQSSRCLTRELVKAKKKG